MIENDAELLKSLESIENLAVKMKSFMHGADILVAKEIDMLFSKLIYVINHSHECQAYVKAKRNNQ